jgi:hypothetical protein
MKQTAISPDFAILTQRSQYQSCHVSAPDLVQPVAAIEFSNNFYSFFQSVPNSDKALGMVAKLIGRGDRLVITQLRKGYGIWVHEPEAKLARKKKHNSQVNFTASCQLLTSRQQYQARDIRVPDVDLPLPGLIADRQNYSMFKVITDPAEALDLVAKITERGDSAVIVDLKDIFLVCVAEPDAQVLESVNISRSFLAAETKMLRVAS